MMRKATPLAVVVWMALMGLCFARQSASLKWVTLTPNQIPLHALWREAFGSLGEAKEKNLGKPLVVDADGTYQPLALTDQEMKMLSDEGALQAKRDSACLERQQRAVDRLAEGGKKPTDYSHAEIRAIQIECRQETLDAAAHVEHVLSEHGRAVVSAWLEQVRQNMKVQIGESEFEHYQRPR